MMLAEAWKLFRVGNGQPYTLFHAHHGVCHLPLNEVLTAVERQVWNPGKRRGPGFISGWHVLFDKEECEEYLERFSEYPECGHRRIVVARISVARTRAKPRATSNVRLARYMRITSEDWAKAIDFRAR